MPHSYPCRSLSSPRSYYSPPPCSSGVWWVFSLFLCRLFSVPAAEAELHLFWGGGGLARWTITQLVVCGCLSRGLSLPYLLSCNLIIILRWRAVRPIAKFRRFEHRYSRLQRIGNRSGMTVCCVLSTVSMPWVSTLQIPWYTTHIPWYITHIPWYTTHTPWYTTQHT